MQGSQDPHHRNYKSLRHVAKANRVWESLVSKDAQELQIDLQFRDPQSHNKTRRILRMEEGESHLWGDVCRWATFGVTGGSANPIPVSEMNHAKITAGHLELQVFNQWESREVNFRFLGLEKLSLNL